MTDLAGFLLARIAEDEETARHVLRFTHQHSEHYHRPGASFDRWSVRRDEEDLIVEAQLGHLRSVPVLVTDYLNGDFADHVARWDPARVLAECEAKRRIVVRCQEMQTAAVPMAVHLATRTLADLALPYAGHADYREEWRP